MYDYDFSSPYSLSPHVQQRMTERNFNSYQIFFVVKNGKKSKSYKGRHKYQLRKKDIPIWVNVNQMYDPLIGMTVILDPFGRTVITAYRPCDKMC